MSSLRSARESARRKCGFEFAARPSDDRARRGSQQISPQLVRWRQIPSHRQPHEQHGAHRRGRGQHEHHDDLIANRQEWRGPRQDLPRHHPRELHETRPSSCRSPSGSSPRGAPRAPWAAPPLAPRSRGPVAPRPRRPDEKIGLQAVTGQGGARHGAAQDHPGDGNQVLGLLPGPRPHDDADDVGQRDCRRDRERERRSRGRRVWACASREVAACAATAVITDEDQQDPVPAGGAEDDGQDESDQVELRLPRGWPDQEVAVDAETLANGDRDDHEHQQHSASAELPRTRGRGRSPPRSWPFVSRMSCSPARNACSRARHAPPAYSCCTPSRALPTR